jgi:hypothetical protein
MKDVGENDVNFADTISNVAEKVADSISHALHPMIEQYAQLFKTGARTPISPLVQHEPAIQPPNTSCSSVIGLTTTSMRTGTLSASRERRLIHRVSTPGSTERD